MDIKKYIQERIQQEIDSVEEGPFVPKNVIRQGKKVRINTCPDDHDKVDRAEKKCVPMPAKEKAMWRKVNKRTAQKISLDNEDREQRYKRSMKKRKIKNMDKPNRSGDYS